MTVEQVQAEQSARLRNERLKTFTLLTTIILTILGLFSSGVAWIENISDHMDRMEKHMNYEDQQMLLLNKEVEWLIRANPQGKEAPDGFEPPPRGELYVQRPIAQQTPQLLGAPFIPQQR